MKKILLSLLLSLTISSSAFATSAGYNYTDGGVIYSDVTMPLSLPTAKYNQDNCIFPTSEQAIADNVDIKTLRTARGSTVNVLGLVDMGNAGIYEIARRAGIKTVNYVDVTNEKLYVPLIFFPIYFKRYITTIYGE